MKFLLMLSAGLMAILLVACGSSNEPANNSVTVEKESSYDSDVETDVDNTISEIMNDFESVKSSIKTYDNYISDTEKTKVLYDRTIESSDSLWDRLSETFLVKMKEIVNSDSDKKFEELGDAYRIIYEDAGRKTHDEIYETFFEDAKNYFYDEILGNKDDDPDHSNWIKVRAAEHKNWINARKNLNEHWITSRKNMHECFLEVRKNLMGDKDGISIEEAIENYEKTLK